MTFGWIMSIPDGESVASCAGHSYGRESSLRAEATGMVSALVFIAIVKQYNSNHDKIMKVKYVSNNMGLVKRGQEHRSYVDLYANTTLQAEYDLTEQI